MILETVYAIHSFGAENDDEIPFQVGEPIIILEKDEIYGDSWWKGRNIHGQVGIFPMTYISYEKPPSTTNNDNNTKENLQLSTSDSTVNVRRPISHPVTWDVDQVCMWLSEKGFESEINHFIDNAITGDVLVDLNISTLSEELNITSCVRIMNAIKELKAQFGNNINENGDISSELEEYQFIKVDRTFL